MLCYVTDFRFDIFNGMLTAHIGYRISILSVRLTKALCQNRCSLPTQSSNCFTVWLGRHSIVFLRSQRRYKILTL